jgi:hypothetical protein
VEIFYRYSLQFATSLSPTARFLLLDTKSSIYSLLQRVLLGITTTHGAIVGFMMMLDGTSINSRNLDDRGYGIGFEDKIYNKPWCHFWVYDNVGF